MQNSNIFIKSGIIFFIHCSFKVIVCVGRAHVNRKYMSSYSEKWKIRKELGGRGIFFSFLYCYLSFIVAIEEEKWASSHLNLTISIRYNTIILIFPAIPNTIDAIIHFEEEKYAYNNSNNQQSNVSLLLLLLMSLRCSIFQHWIFHLIIQMNC